MSKRNIAYIKPRDPSFLAKLKEEVGYKDGPNLETKKQTVEDRDGDFSDDSEDREDEKPTIVVLKPGDLSEELVAAEKARLDKEAAEAPADLTQPIVFRKRHKPQEDSKASLTSSPSSSAKSNKVKKPNKENKRKKTDIKNSAKLSFNADDDEEEEEQ